MNKAILTIASLIAMTVLGSAFVPAGTAPATGYMAPQLMAYAGDNHRQTSAIAVDGRMTLLTFWSSTDASSRVACAAYDRMLADNRDLNTQLAYVAVNLDRSENVYMMTVRHDRLTQGSHTHLDNTQARRAIEDYSLEDGCKSFLIDATGRIVAVNPDPTTVTEMLDI